MKKGRLFNFIYGFCLVAFTAFAVLDTFIIPRRYSSVSDVQTSAEITASTAAPEVSDSVSSADGGVSVTVKTYRQYDTNIYVADVVLESAGSLKTALADSSYGRNIKEATSVTAQNVNAVLAVNGDFYGARSSGYVIKNGVLYRSSSAGEEQEDLVISAAGDFSIIKEGQTSAQALLDGGAQQVLSFGPGLIENGAVTVSESDEVGRSKASNPRTALGQIDSLHYVFVVSDGRTNESTGLSLYQLAEFMQSLGVQTAYNLDGGGSSTMYYNGSVINNPTTDGSTIKERSVSDIVYIG